MLNYANFCMCPVYDPDQAQPHDQTFLEMQSLLNAQKEFTKRIFQLAFLKVIGGGASGSASSTDKR